MKMIRTEETKRTGFALAGVNSRGYRRRPMVFIDADGKRTEHQAHRQYLWEVWEDGRYLGEYTKREAKKAFGARQVRKAIKEGRRC